MEEVVGSIPTRSTKSLNNLKSCSRSDRRRKTHLQSRRLRRGPNPLQIFDGAALASPQSEKTLFNLSSIAGHASNAGLTWDPAHKHLYASSVGGRTTGAGLIF
jgi:hypothetical protein